MVFALFVAPSISLTGIYSVYHAYCLSIKKCQHMDRERLKKDRGYHTLILRFTDLAKLPFICWSLPWTQYCVTSEIYWPLWDNIRQNLNRSDVELFFDYIYFNVFWECITCSRNVMFLVFFMNRCLCIMVRFTFCGLLIFY